MGLTKLINSPSSNVFRRAYIKRRKKSDGLYESEWQSITPYVVKWGTLKYGVDDIKLNKFLHTGITLKVTNELGKFNDENNINSLWYNYLTRYNTLVKIEAGYKTEVKSYGWGFPWGEAWGQQTEYPTDATQGIFIMNQENEIGSDNLINLKCSSLKSIFDTVKPTEISGLGTTLTASEIIEKIRDHSDGSSIPIFRQFITSTSWNIQSTTNYYLFSTNTTLKNLNTVWDLMEKLAEAERFILLINRKGEFVFKDRELNTDTSQFDFYGQGFPRQNIIKLNAWKENYNKVYNSIKLKFLEADTSTSYVTAGTTTVVTPSNIQWKYGVRVYEFENVFINNTATAQSIADSLFSEHSEVKNEVVMKTKFHPTLEPLDKVKVNYHSYNLAEKALWDCFNWDEENWAEEGENFDWDDKEMKILSKTMNLDDFSQQVIAREI